MQISTAPYYQQVEEERPKSSKRRYLLVGVAIAVIAVIVVAYLRTKPLPINPFPPPPRPPAQVLIGGTANATGVNVIIKDLIFTNKTGQSPYPTPVLNNQYGAALQNFNSYSVSADWQGAYPGQSGRITNFTTIIINTTQSLLTQNFLVPTPSSVIGLNGTIKMKGGSVTPFKVNFTEFSPQTHVYSTQIIAHHGFLSTSYSYSNITLPNMADYNIVITFNGILGATKTCSPQESPLYLSEGINVTKLIQNLTNC